MDQINLRDLKKDLISEKCNTIVLLFDPRDELIDESVIEAVSEIEPEPIVIDFQKYDLNNRESLYYIYIDINHYIKNLIKGVDENFKKVMDCYFEEGLNWASVGSHVPISNLLRNFIEEYEVYCGKLPVIVLANIDVETQVNHATIGTIVFDVITSPTSAKVIITCTPNRWTDFEKGRDIFSRVASRLRSCVKSVKNDGE